MPRPPQKKVPTKPVRKPLATPALAPAPKKTRLQRFRQAVSRSVSTTRKKVATGALIGALALGSWGAYQGIQAYRFAQWRQNAQLHFRYGQHRAPSDLVGFERDLIHAKQSAKPFDFLVIESSIVDQEKRHESEARLNRLRVDIARACPAELSRNDWGGIARKFSDRVIGNHPEFSLAQIALAAKYDLRIKLGEEYPRKEIPNLEATFDRVVELTTSDWSDVPTVELRNRVAQGLEAEAAGMERRDRVIAQVSTRAAAELRRDDSTLRGKTIRGIVYLGGAHFSVTGLAQKEGVRGLEITESIEANRGFGIGDPFSDFLKRVRSRGVATNHPMVVNQLVIAKCIRPLFEGLAAKNPKLLNKIIERIDYLTEAESRALLGKVERLTGPQRAKVIVKELTGAELQITE